MYVREGDKYQTVALHGATPAFIQTRLGAGSFTPGPGTALARAVVRRDIVHIADIRMDDEGRDDTLRSEAIEAGIRTLLVVPMLKEGEPIGVIAIYRHEVQPFDRQADRAGHELRSPGCHRHREHAAAQRTAGITPTADCDSRRA